MIGIQMTDYVPVISVKRDTYGRISNGLVVGDILRQNQAVILQAHQGEIKEYPAMGVGIEDMLLDNDPIYWRTRIKEQLEMDNEQVESVKVMTTGIHIEAKY